MRISSSFIRAGIAFAAVSASLSSSPALASVPEYVSFTGRLATADGPVDGAVAVTFELFDHPTAGTLQWTEEYASVLVDDGMLYVELGSVTTLDDTVFDGTELWLQVTVDGDVMGDRVAIESVPYSIRAGVADRLGPLSPADVVTAVTAAAGLTGGGSGGALSLAVDPAAVQSRVATGCAPGESIRQINEDGSVACETDDGVAYTAGAGIAINASVLSVDTSVVQSRVTGSCPAGQSIRAIDVAGGVTCEVDTNSTYGAGTGLTLSSSTFRVDGTVARKDAAAGDQIFNNGTLVLDYANERVGINTNTPAASLHVKGNITTDSDYLYNSGKAVQHQIGAAEFAGTNFEDVLRGGFTLYGAADSHTHWVRHTSYAYSDQATMTMGTAPVRLPDGATVNSVRCRYQDNSELANFDHTTFRLIRTSLSNFSEQVMAMHTVDFPDVESTAVLLLEDTTVSQAVIDNGSYRYHLIAEMLLESGSPSCGGANCGYRFYGCTIDYTLDQVSY